MSATAGHRQYRIVQEHDPMQAVPLSEEESPISQRRKRGVQDWMARLEAGLPEKAAPILEPVKKPASSPLETTLVSPKGQVMGTVSCPHCHHPVIVPVDESQAAHLAQLEREHRQFRFLLQQVINPRAWDEGADLLARIRAALGMVPSGVPAHAE
jgi:hypothetical protein